MHKSLPSDDRQHALQAWHALCTDLLTVSTFENASFDSVDVLTRGHGLRSKFGQRRHIICFMEVMLFYTGNKPAVDFYANTRTLVRAKAAKSANSGE